MIKTANQLWRESGRVMPFKDFVESRKKNHDYFSANGSEDFMYNKPVNDSIQKTLTAMQEKGANTKSSLTKKTILGVPTPVFYGSLAVIAAVIIYYQIKKQ